MTPINKITTIYIPSKERPHCDTAKTLIDIGYPGEWFIVVADNDPYLEEYISNYGKDKILTYDWKDIVERTDLMDNLNKFNNPTGAAPARNACVELSYSRGEKRHWELDDDYLEFLICLPNGEFYTLTDGQILYKYMVKLAEYGESASIGNLGFATRRQMMDKNPLKINYQLTSFMNVSNDYNLFPMWQGKIDEDIIAVLTALHNFQIFLAFKLIFVEIVATQKGGEYDLYNHDSIGTTLIKRAQYEILHTPTATKLGIRNGHYTMVRYTHKIRPKVINEKYEKK